MNDTQKFLESTGFIFSFLVASLGIQTILGSQALYAFLWLVLLSVVVTNADKITSALGGVKRV